MFKIGGRSRLAAIVSNRHFKEKAPKKPMASNASQD